MAAAAGDAEATTRTPLPVGSHRTRVLLGVPSLSRSAAMAAAQHVGSPTAGPARDGGTPMLLPGKPGPELCRGAWLQLLIAGSSDRPSKLCPACHAGAPPHALTHTHRPSPPRRQVAISQCCCPACPGLQPR